MPKYEKKDWMILREFVKKGNSLDFIYDHDEDEVYITLNENTRVNVEDDVKCFITRIFKEEKTLDKVAMNCLANHSYIVYKRIVDRYGNPLILKCNPDTGQMIYSPWKPHLVFTSNSIFTINDIVYENDQRYNKYLGRIREYAERHIPKQRQKYIHNEYYDKNDIVYGEQEDWDPDTFQK